MKNETRRPPIHPAIPLLLLALGAALAPPARAASADAQTVVVSATRRAMALVDAPAAIDVVDREQIAERGADNVFDAVRGEIGVSIQGRTISGRKAINLRGMDSRHTLVLVDGKRIAASDGVIGHSDYQYDWLAVDEIERIEIIRGPMSVLYGAEALGGVVNVITRAPGSARWSIGLLGEGSAADGGRGGDGQRASLHADGPLGGGLRLALGAAGSRRAALASSADPRITGLEGRERHDASLRLHWTPVPGHEWVAEHRVGDETRWADARERGGARRYYRSVTPLERTHSALAWTVDGGGARDWRTLLRAYRSTLDAGNSRDNGVAALRPQRLDDRVLEGHASLVPATAQVLSGGFEWRREQLNNDGLADGVGRAEHGALYVQHEVEVGPALSLTAGLRHDHHSRFGAEWSPRAYLVWRAGRGLVVKGGYGHGFKAPTLKQVSPDYREDEGPYTYFGNAALQPERNDAVELGAGWSDADAGVQAMLFRNRVRDLIVTRLTGQVAGRNQYLFENTERATLQGLEAEVSWRAARALTLGASWLLLDARDGEGQRLERRPRQQLAATLNATAGAWRAGVRVEHQRGQLVALAAGQPLQPLPDVTLVSAHAGVDLGHGLDLLLGVSNLADVDLAARSPLFVYAESPRTWRLTLRGRW